MTGVKGSGGVPPKRADQRRRRNVPAAGEPVQVPGAPVVVMPDANPEWHDIARRWYLALGTSGQSVFYEDSDWMTAYAVAESMSREFEPQVVVVGKGSDATVEMHPMPPKAASLAAWLKAASSLLATEGDRRRAALELTREKDEEGDADVTHLDDVRSRLGAV